MYISDIFFHQVCMIYWQNTLDTIIVTYNESTDPIEREYLYRTHIDGPLRKMIQILVRKLYSPDLINPELEYDLLVYTVLQLEKYTPCRGKSFSYFTVIIKNRILHLRATQYKEERQYTDILGWHQLLEIADEQSTTHETVLKTAKTTYPRQLLYTMDNSDEYTDDIHEKLQRIAIPTVFKKLRQQRIARAVITLLQHPHTLTKYHKKEFLEEIRQQTGYRTVHIKVVIDKLIPHVFP